MTRQSRKPKPWKLDRLLAECRHAGAVYLAVRWLAGDRRQFSPNRATIAAVCGLSERTVGKAITTLHDAGWIHRAYGREGSARRWYRLSWSQSELFPMVRKTDRRERVTRPGTRQGNSPTVRKTDHREASWVSQNVPKGTVPYGAPNVPTPLKGSGVPTAPPASAVAAGGATPLESHTKQPNTGSNKIDDDLPPEGERVSIAQAMSEGAS